MDYDFPQAQDPADYVPETQLPEVVYEGMSESAVYEFLRNEGIPEKYCAIFEENYIDGKELLSLTESDVKALVQPLGIVKKILRLLPQHKKQPEVQSVEETNCIDLTLQTPSRNTSESASVSLCSDSPSTSGALPDLIPEAWRPEVEECIKDKMLSTSARNEIVRTLVNRLFCRANKPSRAQCEESSRRLILKYPFLKDDMDNGYQSWSDKMVERVRNVLKRDSKKGKRPLEASDTRTPTPKRRIKQSEQLRRYPIGTTPSLDIENPETIAEHKKAIASELSKARPRDTVLLPLMKSTFGERRMFILSEEVAVFSILEDYPARLSRPAIIEQEMGLIYAQSDIRVQFLKQWLKFVTAILTFGDTTSKRSVNILVNDVDESDEASKQLVAMKVLAETLGKGQQCLDYFYEEYSSMEDMPKSIKENTA